MSSVAHLPPRGQSAFLCAQSGCALCLDHLLRTHAGLIRAVVRQQYGSALPYADLLQEGRIALWQAIVHYDPQRGIAFSTYAWPAIQHRLWSAVDRAQRPEGFLPLAPSPDPREQAELLCHQEMLRAALQQALRFLPPRLQQVVTRAYGLDGLPADSLAALGRTYGVTRERVRQWRNEALTLLRLPALSTALRRLCDCNDLPAYRQAEALHQAWRQQRRGGRR